MHVVWCKSVRTPRLTAENRSFAHHLDLDLGCRVLQYVFLQQAKEKQLAVLESQIP